MKVCPSVKKMFNKWRVIKRQSKFMLICENSKHFRSCAINGPVWTRTSVRFPGVQSKVQKLAGVEGPAFSGGESSCKLARHERSQTPR